MMKYECSICEHVPMRYIPKGKTCKCVLCGEDVARFNCRGSKPVSNIFDISEPYREEIKDIEKDIDDIEKDIEDEYKQADITLDMECSKIKRNIKTLEIKRAAMPIVGLSINAVELASMDAKIAQQYALLAEAHDRYVRSWSDHRARLENAAADLYIKRDQLCIKIRKDNRRYGMYLWLTEMILEGNLIYYNDFMKEAKKISDYDDRYLNSLCGSYRNHHYYMDKAIKLFHYSTCSDYMYEQSKAKNVFIESPEYISGFDKYDFEASRLCFERSIADIAAMDGSISGIKI